MGCRREVKEQEGREEMAAALGVLRMAVTVLPPPCLEWLRRRN